MTWLFKLLFPKYIWNIKTQEKVIYLTFDDGPIPEITPWVLEQLSQYKAKATFFCVGHNISKYPDIAQKILQENHLIGNHTYNHLKGWDTETFTYLDNFENFEKLYETHFFRPPYGRIKSSQAKEILKSHKIIMWSVLTLDYSPKISPEACLKIALNQTKSGSIVVFHDSLKSEKNLKYALPRFLEHFTQKGFTFKSLPLS